MSLLFTGIYKIEVNSTPSTNAFASGILDQTPPEGTLVITYHQTSGRGQLGSTWFSAPGENLTFSLIFYPRFLATTELFYLSKMVVMAIHRTISHFLPENEVQVKWPNDVLVDQKKIAGILIENQLEGKRIKSSIIGIGLNVNQVVFPEGLTDTATSLRLHTGEKMDLVSVLEYLLVYIEKEYLSLRQGNQAILDRQYLKALYGYQEVIPVIVDGEEKERMLVGVDKSGRLALEENQKIRYFDIKEVKFILSPPSL